MIRTSKYIILFAIILIGANTKAQRHKRKRPLSTITAEAPLIVDSSTIPNNIEQNNADDTVMSMLNDLHIPKLKRQRTHISGAEEHLQDVLEQTDLASNFLDMNKEENDSLQLSGQTKRNRIHKNRGRGVDNSNNILEEGDGPAEIVGGVSMNEGDRTYLVSLGDTSGPYCDDLYCHFCGGTVIGPHVVLTAAHCIIDQDENVFDLEFSTVNLNVFDLEDISDADSYPICEQENGRDCDLNTHAYFVLHPEYNDNPATEINKDFALIFLPEKTDITPVVLNPSDDIPVNGEDIVTFGWGGTLPISDDNLQVFPNIPYIVTLQYLPNDQCASPEYWGKFDYKITPDQLCAYDDGKGACRGDSGGPIVVDYPDGSVQLGITSWGPIECGADDLPSVFSRVSAQYDWIIETICNEIGGEGCSDDDDGQDCFDLSDEDTNEQDTDDDDDMLPGFIRTMINNGQIESDVPVSSMRPNRMKQQKRDRDMTRILMNDNMSLSDEFGIPDFIVGGEEAEVDAQPYFVSIGLDSLGPICGGTLIKHNVILSSASCFTNRNGRKIKMDWIDLGRQQLSDNTGVVRIYPRKDDVWRHIRYDYMTNENDMALIFLNNIRSEIEPVMLNEASNTPETAGDLVEVSGWGATDPENAVVSPDRFHIATLGYVPNDKCILEGFDITNDMMCATSTSDEVRGPCTGDVGGPLIVNTGDGSLQVGVASVGICRTKPPPPIVTPTPDCPDDMILLEVTIRTDNYPDETSWRLFNQCTRDVQIPLQFYGERLNNTVYTDAYCVPSGQEYQFRIFDTFGDGICCLEGDGYYTVTYDNIIVGEGGKFEFEDSFTFGNECPEFIPDPSVYSRVSSSTDWIEKAIQCRLGDDPKASSKSDKSRRPHSPGRHTKASKRDVENSTKSSKKSKVLASTDKIIGSTRSNNSEFGRVVDINMSF